ncbi:MAG: hypothetical protein ABI867_08845 [Kofleriaceae bacterium]
MRWVWRGSAFGVLLIGWLFILFHNNFHVTPPVVFIGLGYSAGIGAIYALFRTGASAVSTNPEDEGDEAWGLPLGARGELEREKRTLLKAIKEAEFDHQMGKLSKKDVDEMIRNYRLRAIDVIKLLEAGEGGGTVREQIAREVRARVEIEEVRSKIEKAHAGLSDRKNQKKAAAAARAAARDAAQRGLPATVAAQLAAAAAVRTDDEADDIIDDDDDDDAAADEVVAKSESKIEVKAEDAVAKIDEAKTDEPKIEAKTETKATNGNPKADAADDPDHAADAPVDPSAERVRTAKEASQ